jgi:hypothetical protein
MNSTGCATQSSRSAAGPRISSRGSAEIEGQIEGRDIAPPNVFTPSCAAFSACHQGGATAAPHPCRKISETTLIHKRRMSAEPAANPEAPQADLRPGTL